MTSQSVNNTHKEPDCLNGIDFRKQPREVSQAIATLSLSDAPKVFTNQNSNASLLREFITKGYTGPNELPGLSENPSLENWRWADIFWKHVTNNPQIGECLHCICNLNNRNLKNYKIGFRQILSDAIKRYNENPGNRPLCPVTDDPEEIRIGIEEDASNANSYLVGSELPQNTNTNSSLRDKIRKMVTSQRFQFGVYTCTFIVSLLIVGGAGVTFTYETRNKDFPILDTNSTFESDKHEVLEKSDDGSDRSRPEIPISTPPLRSFPHNVDVESSTIRWWNPQTPAAVGSPEIISTLSPTTTQKNTKDDKSAIVNQIYAKRPADITQNVESICSLEHNTSLVINAIDPYDWYDFNIDCGPRIRYLTLTGHLSVRQIHNILNQTNKIVNLKLEGGGLCKSSARVTNKEIEDLPVLALSRLRRLVFSGIDDIDTSCKELLTLFTIKITTKVKTMHFHNMAWAEKNKFELQRIIYNARYSLQDLDLNDINLQTSIFDLNFPPLHLSTFHFNVTTPSAGVAYESLANFLEKANSVVNFRSNVEIPESNIQPILKTLKKLNLKVLLLTVGLDADRKQLSLKFLKQFRRLQSCQLNLVASPNRTNSTPIEFINFSDIRQSLTHFQISTNFVFRDLGATDMHCRWYDKSKNFLVLNRCADCDAREGCRHR